MTKRWLSLVLVLTLLASCFVGASAAGVTPKTDKAAITFTPATGVIDLTGKTAASPLAKATVGTFYVDGVKANAAQSTLLQKAFPNLHFGWGGDSWMAQNAVVVESGVMSVRNVFPTAGTLNNGQYEGSTMIYAAADIATTLDAFDYTELNVVAADNTVWTATPKWKIYNPLTGLTLTGTPGAGATVLNKSFVMEGKGITGTLEAAIAPTDGAVESYEWTSSNENVATVAQNQANPDEATVTSAGAGSATITVTAKNDKGDRSTTWAVNVNPVYASTITVEPVVISAANQIQLGTTVQLKATVASAVTETALTWSTGNTLVSSVSSDGLVKLTNAAVVGDTFTIYASDTRGTRGAYNFAVTAAPTGTLAPYFAIDNVRIIAADTIEEDGKKLTIATRADGAQIYYLKTNSATAPTADDVKAGNPYTSSIALDSSDASGFYYAVAEKDGVLSNVYPAAGFKITVEIEPIKVTITAGADEISGRGELTLSAAVTPATSKWNKILWNVVNPDGVILAATSNKDNDVGDSFKLVTAGGSGSIELVATAFDGSGFSDPVVLARRTIEVTDVSAMGVTAPASISVAAGETVKVDAATNPTNATVQTLSYELTSTAQTPPAKLVSGPDEGATIAATENAVYVKGVAEGTSILTITPSAGVRRQITVTVTKASENVAAPTFSEADGKVFDAAGVVTMSCSTVNSSIKYTIDGSDPRTSLSAVPYGGGDIQIPVNTTVTIKAFAEAASKVPSAVATATFSSAVPVTKVVLSGAQTITGTGDPKATAAVNGNTLLTAELTAKSGNVVKNNAITWKSSDESVATVKVLAVNPANSLSQDALIIGVKPGKATITVTTADGGFTATREVTVTEVKPITLAINPGANFSTPVDQYTQLKADFTPAYVTNSNVNWASDNTAVATVDQTGKVTPVAVGSAIISATAAAKSEMGKTVEDTLTVTVTAATGTIVTPTITPAAGTMTAEITVEITTPTIGAEIYYTLNGTTPSASSTLYVEGGFKLHENAIVRAIAIKGNTSIMSASASYIFNIEADKVAIDKSKTTLAVGEKMTLNATLTPDYVTEANKAVTWSVPNNNIVSVNATTGEVTAIAVGSATITANAVGGEKDNITIVVTPVEVTSITIQPSSISMGVGDSKTLSATVNPSNASGDQLTWTTSDAATVSIVGSKITAVKGGTATITATAANGVRGSVTVNVMADPTTAPAEPTKVPTLTPDVKTFEVMANGSLTKVLGKFQAGEGQTWDQINHYYDVTVASLGLANKGTIDVARDGTVTLYITKAGTVDFSFDYTWTLTWKTGRGAPGVLNTENRTITGNTVTVTPEPSADEKAVAAAKDAIGKLAVSIPVADAGTEAAAKAALLVELNKALAGTGIVLTEADITISDFVAATDTTDGSFKYAVALKSGAATGTATGTAKIPYKVPTPAVKEIIAITKTPKYLYKGARWILSLADGTAKFDVPGYKVTNWKSSKPKYLSINATTGEATLLKPTTAITITATIEGEKKKMTRKFNVTSLATEIKLQYKNPKGKWVDFSTTTPMTVVVGKTVKIRAVVVGPKSSKILGATWSMGNTSIASYAKTAIKGVTAGDTTVTVKMFNGTTVTGNVTVSASKGIEDEVVELETTEEAEVEAVEEIEVIEELEVIEEAEAIEEIEIDEVA